MSGPGKRRTQRRSSPATMICQRRTADLRHQDATYRSLFDNSKYAVYISTREGRLLDFNRSMLNLFGYREEEMRHLHISKLYADPRDRKTFRRAIEKHGAVVDYDLRLRRKDGRHVACQVIATVRTDARGKILGYEGIIRDITTWKKIEASLRDSERRYRTTLDALGDPIHVIDRDLRFTLFNQAFLNWNRRLGLATETIGKNLFEVFPFLPARVRQEYRQVFRTGKILVTFEDIRLDSRNYATETRKIPIFGESGVIAVLTVIRDITAQRTNERKIQEQVELLRKMVEDITFTLAFIIEKRDPYTAGHQQRVAQLATAIAQQMRLPHDDIQAIKMAAQIHDIGKIYVPAEILNKPGPLSDIEYKLIKNHPQLSYDILQSIDFPWPIARIVLQHHERIDGSGYPAGLRGKQTLLAAKILVVADVVEAISSNRPYRPAHGIGQALMEIKKKRGRFYEPAVVDACLTIFRKRTFHFNSPQHAR